MYRHPGTSYVHATAPDPSSSECVAFRSYRRCLYHGQTCKLGQTYRSSSHQEVSRMPSSSALGPDCLISSGNSQNALLLKSVECRTRFHLTPELVKLE